MSESQLSIERCEKISADSMIDLYFNIFTHAAFVDTSSVYP